MVTDPSTPANPISISELEQANNVLEITKDKVNSLNGLVSQMSENWNDWSKIMSNAIPGFSDLINNFDKMRQAANDHATAVSFATNAMFKYSKAFTEFDAELSKSVGFTSYAKQVEGMMEVITKATDMSGLVNAGKAAGMSNEEMSKAIKESGGSIDTLKAKIISYTTELAAGADHQKKLSEIILMTAASTGYTEWLEQTTDNYKNLNEYVATQSKLITDIQYQTGSSKEQVMSYYNTLRTIPGIFEKTVVVAGEGTQSLFGTMVKLSEGSKIPLETLKNAFDDARKTGNIMDSDLQRAGTNVAEYLSTMVAAANKLKMEFGEVQTFAKNVGDSFKYFGNEGVGSLKVLNELMPALKGTGLSAQNSRDIIEGMTKQIANLTEAQKGYISQQTGGPGGLQGAFQIDAMLREGKLFEVFQKVRETMTQQMGPLVTLEQAKESQGAAAQYERQLLMLRSGPLGQLAQGMGGAERLADALAAAQEGDNKPLKDASDNLKDMNKKAEDYRQRNATFMTDILGKADQIKNYNEQIAKNTMDSVALVRDPGGRQTFYGISEAREASKEYLNIRKELTESGIKTERILAATKDGGKITGVGATAGDAAVAFTGMGAPIKGAAMAVAYATRAAAKEARAAIEPLFLKAKENEWRIAQERDPRARRELAEKTARQIAEAEDLRSLADLKIAKPEDPKELSDYMAHSRENIEKRSKEILNNLVKSFHIKDVSTAATRPSATRPGMGAAPTAAEVVHQHRYELFCFKCASQIFNTQHHVHSGTP